MAAATVAARFQRASDGGILPPVRVAASGMRLWTPTADTTLDGPVTKHDFLRDSPESNQ
jgi:hypothetical protein